MNFIKILHLLVIVSLLTVMKTVKCSRDDGDDYSDTDGEEDVADQAIECPPQFMNRCTCGRVSEEKKSSFVVNCSGANFNDTSVLLYLPNATEILIFTGNNLSSELPANIFGADSVNNLDKLRLIDMSNNQIRSLKGKTFHKVKGVRKLILDNNDLLITGEHFHPRIFSNFDSLEELSLKKSFSKKTRGLNFVEDLITTFNEAHLNRLRILHLENNGIKSIPTPYDFCSFPSLIKLHLSGNLLTDIKINTTCTPGLRLLDVSDNFIENLTNESLAFIPDEVRMHVNLTANPFRCDCRMKDFMIWSKNTKTWINGKKSIACASGYPESNVGKYFMSLSEEDLLCPLTALGMEDIQGYVTASYAVLISLILALVVLVLALIASHRDQVSKVWNILSNSLAAKREYTSLEQESKPRSSSNGTSSIEVDEVAV